MQGVGPLLLRDAAPPLDAAEAAAAAVEAVEAPALPTLPKAQKEPRALTDIR